MILFRVPKSLMTHDTHDTHDHFQKIFRKKVQILKQNDYFCMLLV